MAKLIKELNWREMKESYKIGTVKVKGELIKVNELQDAIEAGEILQLLQTCADELHNGDFSSAIKAFRRALQSQACNMRGNKIAHTATDIQRYELLEAYTKQFVSTVSSASIEGKAKWQYTIEDIESLKGNHEELRKLYNSMMDKKSKDPESILAVTTMEEYISRVDRVRELRNEAKNETELVSDSIIDKLQNNKKLSKEETLELLKLLGK